jgi:hypothetical protein
VEAPAPGEPRRSTTSQLTKEWHSCTIV